DGGVPSGIAACVAGVRGDKQRGRPAAETGNRVRFSLDRGPCPAVRSPSRIHEPPCFFAGWPEHAYQRSLSLREDDLDGPRTGFTSFTKPSGASLLPRPCT